MHSSHLERKCKKKTKTKNEVINITGVWDSLSLSFLFLFFFSLQLL